ncbi:MAG: hypothetical protein HC934_02870 [Acaryochloridaceae cyanobacterium SU_2_1]|nr:hypothetical protein [Acaryochloridaceae cyanobacterium SU_2_1]
MHKFELGDRIYCYGIFVGLYITVIERTEKGYIYGLSDHPGDCPSFWRYAHEIQRSEVANAS